MLYEQCGSRPADCTLEACQPSHGPSVPPALWWVAKLRPFLPNPSLQMAPELLLGRPCTESVDIYSFGGAARQP